MSNQTPEDPSEVAGKKEGQRREFYLVQNEHFDVAGVEGATVGHVVNTSRGSHNHMDTRFKDSHILTDVGATNGSMAVDSKEVTKSDDNLEFQI